MPDGVVGGMRGRELPGFVDLQVNGGFGLDFTADPASIWDVGAQLPRHGVTAFVPTVITSPPAVALRALEVLSDGPPPGWVGARPLGLHIEGPMISEARRGVHPAAHLTGPDLDLVDCWVEAGPPLMVTLAPELKGSEAVVRRLADVGVVVAVGHSEASAGTVGEAGNWGARHATHLFNAMSGLDHRRPGVAAAVLTDDRFTTGLIADGVHVAPAMLRLALLAMGPERIALVTDATSALGTGPGTHRLGDIELTVRGLAVRGPEGQLAGSAAPMSHLVEVMRSIGCSWEGLTTMTSTTPARIVGYASHPGDRVVLDDDLQVVATVIAGEVVYRRDGP